jgi:GT2 family glycosyltransferase
MKLSQQYTLELILALAAIPVLLLIALAVGRWLTRRIRVPLGVRYRIAVAAFFTWMPLAIYQYRVQSQFTANSKASSDVLVGCCILKKYNIFHLVRFFKADFFSACF